MKKLLTLLFLAMISFNSYGEWTDVGKSVNGGTFYVDFERIKKQGGFVYYWSIFDYFKPTKYGDLSSKVYEQVDCELLRYKYLTDSYYKESMGKGERTGGSNEPDKEWNYVEPKSIHESVLKSVCSQ